MVHTFMEYLMVTVYVLKGDSGKRYVGITKDLPGSVVPVFHGSVFQTRSIPVSS